MNEEIQNIKNFNISEAASILNINNSVMRYLISKEEFAVRLLKNSKQRYIPYSLLSQSQLELN